MRSCPGLVAGTVSLPCSSPVPAPTAAQVWLRLCGSEPITIICTVPSLDDVDEADLRSTHLSRGGCHAPIKSGRRSSGGGGRHNQRQSDHWSTGTKRVSPPPARDD